MYRQFVALLFFSFFSGVARCQLLRSPIVVDSSISKNIIFVVSEFNFIQIENKHNDQPLFLLRTNGDFLGRILNRYRLIGDSSLLNNGKIREDFIKRE